MTINANTTLTGPGEEAPIDEVMGFYDQVSREDKMTYTTVFNIIAHRPEAQSFLENICNDKLEHSKPGQFPGINKYKLKAERMYGNPADPNTWKPVFEDGPDPIIKQEEGIHSSSGINRNHSWQGVESSSSNYAFRGYSPYLGTNDRTYSAPAAYYTKLPTNQQRVSEDTSDAVVPNMLSNEFGTVPPKPLGTSPLVQDFQLYRQVTRKVSDAQSPEAIPNSADSSVGSSSGRSSLSSTQLKNEREMAKRVRNTEAARRSRARKMERMSELERRCDMLMARNEQLEIEVVRLRLLLARDQAIKSEEAFKGMLSK